MSLSVNRVNNNILFKANEKPEGTVNIEKEKADKGLSDSEKKLIGLGALAGITIGGILVKRRLDIKAAEKLAKKAQELLQKPKEFSYDNLRSYAKELNEANKIEAGDEIVLMWKSMLNELAERKSNQQNSWSKLFKAMKMSDNGFALVLRKADKNVDTSTLKYFDPEKITEPLLIQSLRDNKIFIMPIAD